MTGLTRLADVLPQVVKAARQQKLHALRQRGNSTDIPTCVEAWRAGQPAARVMLLEGNRDRMLHVAGMVAEMFSAETLAVSLETYQTQLERHPVTGEEWRDGDQQELAEEHNGITKGWVQACLAAQAINRAGDYAGTFMPYTLAGRSLTWGEVTEFAPGVEGKLTGTVPQVLAEIMNGPPAETLLHRAGLGPAHLNVRPERLRDHLDATAARTLAKLPYRLVVLLAAKPGTPRHQVLRRSLPRAQLLDPRSGW